MLNLYLLATHVLLLNTLLPSKDGNSRHSVVLVRRYYKFYYKAKSWKYPQRVIVKIEVSSMGTNIRFVVTSNRNNAAETVYRHYSKRGEMELWIKDLKYFKADRMSCNSYKANYFRVFLYAAAYTVAYNMKHIQFRDTEVESFTMDSLIKRVMLSAVFIKERKTYVQISFSPLVKTEDIHPPKTGISVHFCVLSLMAMQK